MGDGFSSPLSRKLPKLLTSATRALRSVDQRKQCPCSFLPKHASPLQPTLATHQGATQVGLRAVRLRGPALRGPALQAGGTHRRVSALHEVQEERRAVGLWNGAGSAGTSRVGQRAGAQEAPPGRRPVWAGRGLPGCRLACQGRSGLHGAAVAAAGTAPHPHPSLPPVSRSDLALQCL